MGDPEKKQPAQKPRGMMETQFAAVLADAAKLFKDSSSDRGLTLDDFLTPPIKSISDLMQQLTAQNDQFSHFREKRKSIFDAVAVTLRPIELIGDIVAEGVAEAFAPAQSIFAAVMYLINAAHDVSSMYDSILELFDQLKDFTSRLDVYLNHKLSPALREKLVTILATLFEVLVVATKVARSGRLKAYFKRLVGIESPVEPALQKLNAFTLGEERQVIAETYDGVAELNLKTDKVEDLVTQMHESILDMRLGEQQNGALSYRDKLREILEPTPYSDDSYNAFTKYRVQGTGDWLLEDEGLKSWLRGETRHLWMCGNPGTGKSFLTSRLITWGLENLPHLGYFFFSANDPETRSVLQALRDVAYQLSETDAFYAEKLAKQLHSGDDIKTVPSAFRRLFVQPFLDDARDEPSYVFLDGIDEAEQSDIEQLLSLLAPEDEESEPTKVQFALTGRTYLADIVSFALDPNAVGQVFTTVYVTPDRIADDVSAFISEGVRHSRILSRSPEDFKQEVIESMKKQVDGLFILAKFMLNEINQKRHPSSILKSLKSFPKEINGMLNETLANLSVTISEEDARDLNEMLQWVSCAEESLTLEQLEAALVMKFGDAPLRLEESLRGQYACFFELEREDGLTTDDLLKDFARTQREVYPERSFRNESPRARGLSSSDTSSPGRRVSPAGRGVWSHSTSPPAAEKKMASPPRHFSPARSPGLFDMSNEVEFRSNPSTTYVTFSHTSVRQFFRDGNANGVHAMKGGVAMGFDMMTARISILKTCLRIFNDKTWFESRELDHGREAIKQYAAWYWQEHLAALDPASVPPEHKRELGMHIYSMLTVENIIYDWSAMYEKNNEGLEVFTDSNIQGLRKWLNDPAILASLTSEARDFVTKSAREDVGICQAIGRFYAKQWLSEDYYKYVPTLFCFKIVQNVAFMSDERLWSQAQSRWSEIPVRERVLKAIEWAGYPQTAHWHRRLGSTYLMLGLHSDALMHYHKALELDNNNSVGTAGRIAYCLSKYGQFGEALAQALKCAEIEERSIREGTLEGYALTSCRWRLYKDHLLIARCSYMTGKREAALEYFRKAIASAPAADLNSSERFEAELSYLEMLATENLHSELVDLLQEMANKASEKDKETTSLTNLLLDNCDKPLVLEWIPRAAVKVGQVAFILHQYEVAIETAHTMRNQMGVLYLRLAYGNTCAYNRDLDASIAIFEQISLIEYRPRGNVPTRHGHATSFQKLSALYKQKILQVELTSPEAAQWLDKLEQVQEKQSRHQNRDIPADKYGSDVNIASVYLALFHRLLKNELRARQLLGSLVINSLDILLDDEPRNDRYAADNLLQAFIAADDAENALALARSMRKVNRAAAAAAATTTPLSSPVRTRIEPKLPDIQAANKACAQCLDNISLSDNFYLCQLCVDAYCERCLHGVIQQPGNRTCDGRRDVVCRSDHAWFMVPPLNQFLHTGEILWGDGMVKSFIEWERALRQRWCDGT